MFVDNHIRGNGEFEGSTLHIWAKNENHISWLNDKPCITSPDLIQLVVEKTGESITNTDTAVGMRVTAAAAANPLYRSPEGLRIMGPSHYGFGDIVFTPMEKLV